MAPNEQQMGDFRIGEVLGRGGFKTVYRAENLAAGANGWPEAVAVCVPHAQDDEARELLQRECRIAQSLQHPAVVRMYGVEEAGDTFFAVTELVEGQTLSEHLKEHGPMAIGQGVDVVRQIGRALDYLHESLHFHRDIKPGNIMLEPTEEGSGPRARLLDFGLTRLMAHSQYLATTRVGSMGYMAPEQFGGAAGMRADVWSLGVTFYQMLTGALPFGARDEASLMHHILYESPDLDTLEGGEFDIRLVGVMRRVLEKDPDKRYAAAGEFVADLEAVLAHAGAVNPLEGEIEIRLRAHFPLLFIESHEEARVLHSLERIREVMSLREPCQMFVWSETIGLRDHRGQVVPQTAGNPLGALQAVIRSDVAGIFVFLDIHRHFTPVSVRLVRDAIWTVKRQRKSLVFVSPVISLPEELQTDATLLSYPAPDMDRLRQLVGEVHAEAAGDDGDELPGDLREAFARALVGLIEREALRVLRRAAIGSGGLDRNCLPEVVAQKRQAVRQSGVLEFIEPNVDFDGVGGLQNLKRWFRSRRRAFSPEGRRFGLRSPRGVVLVGVPGCGKSLSAKALAADWQTPLLRLDMGRLRGSLMGESERRLRLALETAELAAPCVLWIDELEKAFSGLGQNNDSGVGQRMFGQFLNWLSDRRGPVFVVATANDVTKLPPEFTRKGRFDEMFFLGLPSSDERRSIWEIHLQRPRRREESMDIQALVTESDGYTGAEIAEAVVSGMFQAFDENARDVGPRDILDALRQSPPISQSHARQIQTMAHWARQNAIPAS